MSKGGTGRLRIIGGDKRGRLIGVPKEAGVRPTSEVVREAIFDVLGEVKGSTVLDLFAGSGALGLEALSRRAESCVFVESARRVVSMLRKNIESLGYESQGRVLMKEYQVAVSALIAEGNRFDLLFVDPPYRILAEVEEALTGTVTELLSARGVVVVEGPKSEDHEFGLRPVFERVYGDTKVTMVRLGD